jgi:hypothetical protein
MRFRLGGALATVAITGCSYQADFGASKTATETFHHLMDRGEYAAIYDSSANGFRGSLNRENSVKFFARINRKMGVCEIAPATFGGYRVTPSATFVTVNSSRTCRNGTLEEQFVWLMIAGKPALLKYNANNPLLLVD